MGSIGIYSNFPHFLFNRTKRVVSKWLQLLTSELWAQFPVSSQYLEPLDLVVVSPGLNNKLYNVNNVLTENSSDSRLVSTGMISATTGTIHISRLIMRTPAIATLRGFRFRSQDEKGVDDCDDYSWSHAANCIISTPRNIKLQSLSYFYYGAKYNE